MVALPAPDGRQFVYRVYAPGDALPGDVFWSAFHCHEDTDSHALPPVSDAFDAAEIWHLG
ncbi:hypothetical protein GL263_03005 [Streptomyces durbertensis]|uniref:Uncharacterized protein n=1 Tax=Streptomyces durbertensis TaxID=2448886 RepID=A0ABR6EBB6_9ACTN|nr:hypothetical protein [Streptomyces durbertensis]MBB1242543.1 hypothetical protein [Streptomyces durbertensis]